MFNHHYARIGLFAIAEAMEGENPIEARALRRQAVNVSDAHDTMFDVLPVDTDIDDEKVTSEEIAQLGGALMHSPDPETRRVAASAVSQAKRRKKS